MLPMQEMKKSIMIDLFFWLFVVLESFHYAWSCEITMEPNGTRSFLLGDYFNFTCYANDNCSYSKMSVYENGTEGGSFSQTWCSSYHSNFSNCSGYISINENFLDLKCVGYKSDYNHTRVYSTNLLLQVQETLEPVTGNLVVRIRDNSTLNISWNPVFAYQGLDVYYDITFNETVHTTSNTTMAVLPTLEMDECQFASILVKPFIKSNSTNYILNGTTKQWNISIAIPPMISNSNYTLMMRKNKSAVIDVLVKFNLTNCDCSGRTNEVVLILKNDSFSYFNAAPLILNTADTCYGVATLILPPCISFESEIILKNEVGNNDGKRMFIDTNPLKNASYTNGSLTCFFTDDVMIANNYSTGCVVYYTNMSQPAYAMRDNDNSTATTNIDISSNGYYVMPLPLNSVYKSVKPSSSTHVSISSSVSPSTLSNETKNYILPIILILLIAISIAVNVVLVIILFCCYKCYHRRNFRFPRRNVEELLSLDEIPATRSTSIHRQPEIQTAEIGTQTVSATTNIHTRTKIQTAEIGTQTVPATTSIHTQTESIQKSHAGIQVDLKQDVAMEFKQAQAPVSDKGKHTLSTGEATTYETNIELSDLSLSAVKSILLDHKIEHEEDTAYLTEAITVALSEIKKDWTKESIDSSHTNKHTEADAPISSDDASTEIITGFLTPQNKP